MFIKTASFAYFLSQLVINPNLCSSLTTFLLIINSLGSANRIREIVFSYSIPVFTASYLDIYLSWIISISFTNLQECNSDVRPSVVQYWFVDAVNCFLAISHWVIYKFHTLQHKMCNTSLFISEDEHTEYLHYCTMNSVQFSLATFLWYPGYDFHMPITWLYFFFTHAA